MNFLPVLYATGLAGAERSQGERNVLKIRTNETIASWLSSVSVAVPNLWRVAFGLRFTEEGVKVHFVQFQTGVPGYAEAPKIVKQRFDRTIQGLG